MRFLIILITFFTLISYAQNTESAYILKDDNNNAKVKYNSGNNIYLTQISKYDYKWHNIPLSHGISETCWAYSAISFLESEEYRISKRKVKLSEMFVVYYEYVDKAIYFVETRGESQIREKSNNNAVLRIIKSYGIVPFAEYDGLPLNNMYNDHRELLIEFNTYLESVKKTGNWDIQTVVENIKSILDKHLDKPPSSFTIDGVVYNPITYLKDYLCIKPNEYFSFMSNMQFNYNEKSVLFIDDKCRNCHDFYNINLEDFMNLFHKAITGGYTISLCGDITEPGVNKYTDIAVISSFDIPKDFIDKNARQFRLENNTTTNDLCVHIVGYKEYNDEFWYLVKSSDSDSFEGKNKGYRFFHQDYIMLKMINFMIHVDVARSVLDSIIK